jgi:hypothetical protein
VTAIASNPAGDDSGISNKNSSNKKVLPTNPSTRLAQTTTTTTTYQQRQDQQQRRPSTNKRGPVSSSNSSSPIDPTNNNIRRNNYNKNHNNNTPKQRMNEFGLFNNEIVKAETAFDVLSLLASRKGALSWKAGGGAVSTVNFCTALHRIARHVNNFATKDDPRNNRGRVLSDPRFALFICGVAETLLDGTDEKLKLPTTATTTTTTYTGTDKKCFGPRELSNVIWAIAKLNIAPPNSVMAVTLDDAEIRLRMKTEQLRSSILDIAKQRTAAAVAAAPGENSISSSSSWIPILSEVCGIIVDTVSAKTLLFDYKDFQQQEFSNLIWALTTADRPTEPVFSFIVSGIISSASNPRKTDGTIMPQEWSIPLWCMAKTGYAACLDEQIVPFVNNLLDNEPGFLQRFKPQELSNTVWAVAKILSQRPVAESQDPASYAALGICRHAAREAIRRGGGYKSQELSNTAWAMATLGFGVSNDMSSGLSPLSRQQYIFLPTDDPDGDRSLVEEMMSIFLRQMKDNLRTFSMQELNNMCWSMARLNQRDDALLDMIGVQLANPRRQASPQDMSTSLWSMATMGFDNKAVYRAVVSRLAEVGVERFKPQEISNTLWALASAEVVPEYIHAFDDRLLPDNLRPTMDEMMRDPVTACFALGASELIRRPSEFKPQEIKDVLWSFARVGVRHPVLFQTVAEHLVGKGDDPNLGGRGGLGMFNNQGVSNLAYAYAKHSQIGSEVLEQFGKRCRIPAGGGRLGCYTVSFLDIGEGLLRKLFTEIARVDLEVHGTVLFLLRFPACVLVFVKIHNLHCNMY